MQGESQMTISGYDNR